MSDEPSDLRLRYFDTLREEIKETKSKIFILLMVGLIGMPVMSYFTGNSQSRMLVVVAPLLVLVFLVLYLSMQTQLMRAARYIRDSVEIGESGWEHWIGRTRQRSAEQQFFALVMVIGLFFYALTLVTAMEFIKNMPVLEYSSYIYFFWHYGLPLMYIVATLWGLVTLMRFWRHAVVNK